MIYETDRIILRLPTRETKFRKWVLDQIVTEFNSWGKLTNFIPGEIDPSNNVLWEVTAKIAKVSEYSYKAEKIIIGRVMLANINWINRSAEFSCIFGEPYHWRNGYATEAIRILFTHGFNKLNLHKIWLGTCNPAMVKVAEKLGMSREGVFASEVFIKGKWLDVYRYGIFHNEWSYYE